MGVEIYLKEGLSKRQYSFEAKYSVVQEDLYHPDLGEYHTYGIHVTTSDRTDIIHDVSVCENTVNHIVELINRYQLSPCHLYDVVMDMLP